MPIVKVYKYILIAISWFITFLILAVFAYCDFFIDLVSFSQLFLSTRIYAEKNGDCCIATTIQL